MVKSSSKPSSKSGSTRNTAELLRWLQENPPDSFASHSRADVLHQEREATRLWDEQVARDQAASEVSRQRAAELERLYGPDYREIVRSSGRARAQAWACTHFRDSSATQEEETTDTDWRPASASLRPNITSEELIRDILAALLELGVVSTWGNNLALQQDLQVSDPVIARRVGILRLRFNPESIPDSATYRRLILLTSSGLQGLASTVSDFLRENQHVKCLPMCKVGSMQAECLGNERRRC
jgi:hypothetical protein